MLITTSTTGSLLVVRNRNRKSIVFQNTDGTDSVYIKRERGPSFAVASTDFDYRLGPGASFGINSMLDGVEAIQDSYSVRATANTPIVAVFETEDIVR